MELVDRRRLSPDDSNFKRRMKTPVQLEALERVFAGTDTYYFLCTFRQLNVRRFVRSISMFLMLLLFLVHVFAERPYLWPDAMCDR
jgi:hypothetical protein